MGPRSPQARPGADLRADANRTSHAVGLDNKSTDELRDDLWERIAAKYAEKEKIVPPS